MLEKLRDRIKFKKLKHNISYVKVRAHNSPMYGSLKSKRRIRLEATEKCPPKVLKALHTHAPALSFIQHFYFPGIKQK